MRVVQLKTLGFFELLLLYTVTILFSVIVPDLNEYLNSSRKKGFGSNSCHTFKVVRLTQHHIHTERKLFPNVFVL